MDEHGIAVMHSVAARIEQDQEDDGNKTSSSSSGGERFDSVQGRMGVERNDVSRKHRRKRKRKWKPYTELSWDERVVLDARETKRAYAKRERLSAEGHPIAPYNTTQFLMDDHKQNTPDLRESSCDYVTTVESEPTQTVAAKIISLPNSQPQDGVSNDMESLQKYVLQDFSHIYADIHAEHLQKMSKSDLITEYIKLEKKVETLERSMHDIRRKYRDADSKIKLVETINQLQAENARLQRENLRVPKLPLRSDDASSSSSVDS